MSFMKQDKLPELPEGIKLLIALTQARKSRSDVKMEQAL